ncbi:MAG: tetratricopeptide repeat protein [Isosphaeraceae bacterium]|nr:tetratricopeptide repeat protein [Isosphaeraceae bacterium]
MTTESEADRPSPSRRPTIARIARLGVLALVGTAIVAGALIGPGWFVALVPRRIVRRFVQTTAYALIATWSLAVLAAPVGLVFSVLAVRRARRERRSWTRAGRVFLFASSALIALLIGEGFAKLQLDRLHRIPKLENAFPTIAPSKDDTRLRIAVIGESSARGEPYQPWLSAIQIVERALDPIFPDRRIEVSVLAQGGFCLEQAILELEQLKLRPDAIVLYAGHNEFAARMGWDRNGAHYVGEFSPKSLLRKTIESLEQRSYAVSLAREVIDLQEVDTMPLPNATRAPIDHPAFSSDEYAFLRQDFEKRISALLAYCDRTGILPILIMPPSNDADTPPFRSYLAASTDDASRASFETRFLRVKEREAEAPDDAIAGYRSLLDEQPRFAEAHYRLGRLLMARGEKEEARRRFTAARDLDGMPMRCPSDFRAAYVSAAARRPRAIVIDPSEEMLRLNPNGQMDFGLFHDAQHPNLVGYVGIANAVLSALEERRALGWPEGVAAPRLEPRAVAADFNMNREKWVEIARRSENFYRRTASMRYDRAGEVHADRYAAIVAGLIEGGDPEALGLISLDRGQGTPRGSEAPALEAPAGGR